MWVDWVKFWDLNDIGDVPIMIIPVSLIQTHLPKISVAPPHGHVTNKTMLTWVVSVMTIGNVVVNDILALIKKLLISALGSFLNTIHR